MSFKNKVCKYCMHPLANTYGSMCRSCSDIKERIYRIAYLAGYRAEAEADSMKRKADATAYKRIVEADAEAYALLVIREQLEQSKQLIEYKAIEQWDGILPKFTGGGAIPFIDVQSAVED